MSRINSWLARVARGTARYGPMFAAEVVLFWLIVEAVNSSGYGTVNPWPTRPWYPAASFLIVAFAMGFGEARLRLYRRVWSVASLNDAFAIGLAVVEASLIVTIVNFLFPDGYRPLRVGAPMLAAPAVVIQFRISDDPDSMASCGIEVSVSASLV